MLVQERVLLNVKRYKQKESECAIAAASSVSSYYVDALNYNIIRKMVPMKVRSIGMDTSEQASLFNKVGFKNVSIVTSDLDLIDYSWSKLSRKNIIKKLNQLKNYYRYKVNHECEYERVSLLLRWLGNYEYNNNIIIDYDFPKYIKRSLNFGRPVCAAINATSMFKIKKWPYNKDSDIKGLPADHAIVIRGYDSKGVYIVDSDHGFSFKWLKKFENGYYKISWDKLLSNMHGGDLVLVRP